MSIEDIEQEVIKKLYEFFNKLELTKKNNFNNDNKECKNKVINKIINDLILDINNYKDKLGFYKHVQKSDEDNKQLLKLFGKKRSIYEVNYGYLFHFICWYMYRLISFKKFEEININPIDSKYHNVTKAVASGNKIYDFIYDFTKRMIEKNSNLLDFCKEILPIIFFVWELILKNKNYTFIELIKDDSPDYYVLYKNNLNNKSYVWPIEIGGIYVEYSLKSGTQILNYNKILNVISKKLDKYNTYTKNANNFYTREDITEKISNKLGDHWELQKPLIALFPINKRICEYELLLIVENIKKLCKESNRKEYRNILNELNNDSNNTKIKFFCLNSFYCDSLIFLISKKTNFEKSIPSYELLINFKNKIIGNESKIISIYKIESNYSDEEKKLIKDVIRVLENDDNILVDNKIKNILCKDDGDIESIELFNV